MSSLITNLNSLTVQEIVNWVTFTPPTQLNSTVASAVSIGLRGVATGVDIGIYTPQNQPK